MSVNIQFSGLAIAAACHLRRTTIETATNPARSPAPPPRRPHLVTWIAQRLIRTA